MKGISKSLGPASRITVSTQFRGVGSQKQILSSTATCLRGPDFRHDQIWLLFHKGRPNQPAPGRSKGLGNPSEFGIVFPESQFYFPGALVPTLLRIALTPQDTPSSLVVKEIAP